jgi:hypothetical protein
MLPWARDAASRREETAMPLPSPSSLVAALALLVLVGVGTCDFCDSPVQPPLAGAPLPHSAEGPTTG